MVGFEMGDKRGGSKGARAIVEAVWARSKIVIATQPKRVNPTPRLLHSKT